MLNEVTKVPLKAFVRCASILEELRKTHCPVPLTDAETTRAKEQIALYAHLAFLETGHLFKTKLENPPPERTEEFLAFKAHPEQLELFLEKIREDLPLMNRYLEEETKRVLRGTFDKQESLSLHKSLRAIFLFLLSKHPYGTKRAINEYAHELTRAYGNKPDGIVYEHPTYYFSGFTVDKELETNLCTFLQRFALFRRHLYTHVKHEKIASLLQKKTTPAPSERTQALLEGTFFHGTHALDTTVNTDLRYIPTGWLQKLGIVPTSGELEIGITEHGINQHRLSGTNLDCIEKAISYATADYYGYSANRMERYMDSFLTINLGSILDPVELRYTLSGIENAIHFMASTEHEKYEEKRPELLKQCQTLIAQLETIQDNSRIFLDSVSDEHYRESFLSTCTVLLSLERFLNSPKTNDFISPEEKQKLQNSLSIVIGSKTAYAQPVPFDYSSAEYNVLGDLKLGEDIQLLATREEDIPKALQFLEEQNLTHQIALYTFKEFEEATTVNKIISPYLADIFSAKKIAMLATR